MTDYKSFLHEARAAYLACNRETLEWVLDRGVLAGGFLNTKVNSITLRDYGSQDGWRGPDYTYGWIQGRGLEALVTHAAFFEKENPVLAGRLDAAARTLYSVLAPLYDRYGAAFFCYDTSMTPVRRDAAGKPVPQIVGSPYFTYSDAFVLKGLVAATTRFELSRRDHYLARLSAVVEGIGSGLFIGDEQLPLNAESAAEQEAEFGPRMILMGAAGMLTQLGLHDAARFGDRFIAHVLERHWDNGGDTPSFLVRDIEGGDRCNVGHAIELAGFAYEYLPDTAPSNTLEAIRLAMISSFRAAITEPGLCLHVSASSGQHVSPYFPWWSLPETVRAASLCYLRRPDEAVLDVWKAAHDAFFRNYWRAGHGLAYQTRDRSGPVDFVPATPDLDPGYHTGLSLLAAIHACDRLLAAG